MSYLFPFGEPLHALTQEDRTPKKIFVLGVYASAVHATWKKENKIICRALAVASEPRIFWDGNPEEAKRIISGISIPAGLGYLEPAGNGLNGPSAKVLDENILKPLGYTRAEAWLCDLLPESRLNSAQTRAIESKYNPLISSYGLNPVTVPPRPSVFCDEKRCLAITEELMAAQADTLVLLGDIPIRQYLKKIADIPYSSLGDYVRLYGYGTPTEITINGKPFKVLPLAHPRQIGALGAHSEKWSQWHKRWEESLGKGELS
ncbi:MAG: hypothetical protein IJA86_05395 [Clostridia bacterium]|nr:hypothetical protein [Clostridia bacterium]